MFRRHPNKDFLLDKYSDCEHLSQNRIGPRATGGAVSCTFQSSDVDCCSPTDNQRLSCRLSVTTTEVISSFLLTLRSSVTKIVRLSSRSTKAFELIWVHRYSILILPSPVAQSDSGNLAKVHPVVTYLGCERPQATGFWTTSLKII